MTDTATFRQFLGHVPTAVAVVTAVDGDGPAGMTVGSFTSISLDPPLVGFFADAGSSTVTRVHDAGRFCVNVLTEAQQHLCRTFAGRAADRFLASGMPRPATARPGWPTRWPVSNATSTRSSRSATTC